MNRIVSIICILSAITSFCQKSKTDSLLSLLDQKDDQARVLVLHDIVKSLWTTEPQSAVKYGREAIALSKDLKDRNLESISYRLFGGLYNYMSLIDSGRYFKSQALKIALELNDSLLLAPTYNNLGVTSQTTGNYVEALNYYYMAYLTGRDFDGFGGLPIVLTNISEVYYDMNEYDSAIKYAEKAVYLTQDEPKTSRYLLTKTGLARANLANGNFEMAENGYRSIIAIGQEINEKRYTAYAFQGLGRLNTTLGNHYLALQQLTEALKLFTILDDQSYIAEIFMDLSVMYLPINFDSAYVYAQKSLSIAQDLALSDIQLSNYENLIQLFGSKRNYDSIQHYTALHQKIEVANRKRSNTLNLQGMFAKIQEEHIKGQLAERSVQLERKTYQTNFFIAIALLTISFSAVVFTFFQKQRNWSSHLANANKLMTTQNETIDKKNRQLETLNNEKNSLIGIVAHDLKNPLANIINSTRLLSNEIEDTKQRQLILEIIEGSATRLTDMITKILDVETIEQGLTKLELTPVNLSEIVDSVCEDFKQQAAYKQILIHKKLHNDLTIMGDSTHLFQIAENLVSNAIKFSPSEKNVFVELQEENELALLKVRDEGPGISEKDQKLLFRVYQKLSATPTGKESSTGLGLSIVKKFVNAMNGQIWCKSTLGEGAIFTVQFPLA